MSDSKDDSRGVPAAGRTDPPAEPTDQPHDAGGRLLLNSYGRQCYELGYDRGKAASGWQPIATAPQDGTEVLGVGEAGYRYVMRWSEIIGREAWNDGEYTLSPTHWQALPPPPDQESK